MITKQKQMLHTLFTQVPRHTAAKDPQWADEYLNS